MNTFERRNPKICLTSSAAHSAISKHGRDLRMRVVYELPLFAVTESNECDLIRATIYRSPRRCEGYGYPIWDLQLWHKTLQFSI